MTPTTRAAGWSLPARVCASAAILVYVTAVIAAPLSGPPPASRLSNLILQPFRPLLGALYLGHGYRFFAPDPGPGHSIAWTMTMPDGTEKSGRLPDPETDWPRLLYHRRFMVSEKIAALVPPADAPVDVRGRSRQDWLPLVKGVARNLLRTQGGSRVTLSLTEHYLPTPEEVISRATTADAVTPLGTFGWAEEGRR